MNPRSLRLNALTGTSSSAYMVTKPCFSYSFMIHGHSSTSLLLLQPLRPSGRSATNLPVSNAVSAGVVASPITEKPSKKNVESSFLRNAREFGIFRRKLAREVESKPIMYTFKSNSRGDSSFSFVALSLRTGCGLARAKK